MDDPIAVARRRSLPRLRRMVLRGWPRFAVGAMLALTTLAGFLCSVALLRVGVGGMGLRYAASVFVAYAMFLAQLRIWVALVRRGASVAFDALERLDPSDFLDVVHPLPDGGSLDLVLPEPSAPDGGSFGGGGASGTFEVPDAATDVGSAAIDGVLDIDLDGWPILAVTIVLAVLVAGGAVAAGYVVYAAPTLLAEVFFDAVVAGVLYRRLRRGSDRAWWRGALSRTWIPALIVLVFFGLGGRILEKAVPEARSIGDVLRAVVG